MTIETNTTGVLALILIMTLVTLANSVRRRVCYVLRADKPPY